MPERAGVEQHAARQQQPVATFLVGQRPSAHAARRAARRLAAAAWGWRLPIAASATLALAETAPIAGYAHTLLARDAAGAVLSLVCSGLGTAAGYLALLAIAARSGWLAASVLPAIAVLSALTQLVHFGVWRELGALPSVSTVDFIRQNTRYAAAILFDRLDAPALVIGTALGAGAVAALRRASRPARDASPRLVLGLAALGLASHAVARAPFLSMSQRAAQLAMASFSGPGSVNTAWVPDRAPPASEPARHALNFIVFRLEEIAARATTLERPALLTTPFLKTLADEHPDATFIGLRHFSNATATDVSVFGIFSGLAPAASLEAQRRVPMLWDYFQAAGYDTSLFMPDHLEWGDFRRRFAARPGELKLNTVVDAGNSGAPLVYDHSINDSAVIEAALAYQQRRRWAEPFLQVISLRMPHALGEGARINQLSRGPWPGEPRELWDYYDGIRHDDALMEEVVARVPERVRTRTALVFVSDHGTRLFARRDGDAELHRLDNYHGEATRVPFVLHLPTAARRELDGERLQRLRQNLSTHATSNIDLVPTLLGLAGIGRVALPLPDATWLAGRDLGAPLGSGAPIVQCNTGPLRRWDREHFAIVMDDGAHHYFSGPAGEQLFDLRHDALERIDVAAEAAFRAPLERARALARAVPELWRIQQRNARPGGPGPEPAASGAADPLHAPTAPPERSVLSPAGPDQKIAALAIAASDTAIVTRFAVRITRGRGHLEWRVRGASDLSHVARVEGLEPGDVQRFEFRWRSPAGADLPLGVELWGGGDAGEELELRWERSEAQPGDPQHSDPWHAAEQLAHSPLAGSSDAGGPRPFAEGPRALEVLRFEAGADDASRAGAPGVAPAAGADAPPDADATASLGSFTQHACLASSPAEACPNGFLAWGPYVPARRGARIALRYDVAVAALPPRLWIDIAAAQGSRIHARSRAVELAEPGSRTLLLLARLDADATDLEGRLNAHGGARVEPGALLLRDAVLRVEPAP